MEIPQSLLYRWAARLDNSGLAPSTQAVHQVAKEMKYFASANEREKREFLSGIFNNSLLDTRD